MFDVGIQVNRDYNIDAIANSVLSDNIEIRIQDIELIEELAKYGKVVKGIIWNPYIYGAIEAGVLSGLRSRGVEYVIVETKNPPGYSDSYDKIDRLIEMLDNSFAELAENELCILIENSNDYRDGRYIIGDMSDGKMLCQLVVILMERYKYTNIGVCADIGVANLVAVNLKEFIKDCLPCLGLVHVNDNDGIRDMQQMPFTFTVGRGIRTTNIYGVIGQLVLNNYKGMVVFNNCGTYMRAPKELHSSMTRILEALNLEWIEHIRSIEALAQPGKQLIMFGAGKMLYNYMNAYGQIYPPSFAVDNNPACWGEERWGVEIKSPEDILSIPDDERNVYICTMYYDAIGKQLKEMGVEYSCFIDQYYI